MGIHPAGGSLEPAAVFHTPALPSVGSQPPAGVSQMAASLSARAGLSAVGSPCQGPLHGPPAGQGGGISPRGAGGLAERLATNSVGGTAQPPQTREFGPEGGKEDLRAGSFVRLNSFLWRTHLTCLVSALAEDGWLETWERDQLCDQARNDSVTWSIAFMRNYMRFMESEDVQSFVLGLRAQI